MTVESPVREALEERLDRDVEQLYLEVEAELFDEFQHLLTEVAAVFYVE